MKAILSNYKQAPRKVRLVADLIKGKSVQMAELELKHLAKRAALPMEKLLASAVANAKNAGADVATLKVANVRVDKGLTMKRMMPRAFGRGAPIHKHMSHVILTLAETSAKAKKAAPAPAPVKKAVAAKKPVTKKAAPKAKATK